MGLESCFVYVSEKTPGVLTAKPAASGCALFLLGSPLPELQGPLLVPLMCCGGRLSAGAG